MADNVSWLAVFLIIAVGWFPFVFGKLLYRWERRWKAARLRRAQEAFKENPYDR